MDKQDHEPAGGLEPPPCMGGPRGLAGPAEGTGPPAQPYGETAPHRPGGGDPAPPPPSPSGAELGASRRVPSCPTSPAARRRTPATAAAIAMTPPRKRKITAG